MASSATIVGIVLIVGLIGVGVAQSVFEDASGSTLAGAVTAPEATAPEPAVEDSPIPAVPTQQEINLCMNKCMYDCVVHPGDEVPCTAGCEEACDAA